MVGVLTDHLGISCKTHYYIQPPRREEHEDKKEKLRFSLCVLCVFVVSHFF